MSNQTDNMLSLFSNCAYLMKKVAIIDGLFFVQSTTLNTMRLQVFYFSLFVLAFSVSGSDGSSGFKESVYSSTYLQLPTLYEYYTSGGIHSGLSTNSSQFALNGKPIVLLSGTFHYFRVVPDRWRDILRRMKAAGLNAVQTYVAWNAHEDVPGVLDFESRQLNLAKFLEMIRQEDMFAIVRPGPFICDEWEFGGLPSWLLRDPNMAVRTNYPPYLDRVKSYWTRAMSIINRYQFSVTGGPVIMVQLENEYGGWIRNPSNPNDPGLEYIRFLLNLTRETGYRGQLFTCDNGQINRDPVRLIPEVLEVVNGNQGMYEELMGMRRRYPNRPVYVSEFWNGWFDGWTEHAHYTMSLADFTKEATDILFRANGSINFYPFIGGTNFGFMNGGYAQQGDFPNIRVVTSEDWNAPLTEAGNYTDKYYAIRKFYDTLVLMGRLPKLRIPDIPEVQSAYAYGKVNVTGYYPLERLLESSTKFVNVPKPVSMEQLEIGHGYGQRYGFVLYRVETKPVKNYEITGPISDRGIFLVDGQQLSTIIDASNFIYTLTPSYWSKTTRSQIHLDMLVENLGRPDDSNLQVMQQNTRKGITSGSIKLDGQIWSNLTIFSLDFNQTYISTITSTPPSPMGAATPCPALFITHLTINQTPQDTYLQLPNWTKGSVFVNGFNLGRYWAVGPQQTLYVPGTLLRKGVNQIAVFELHKAGDVLQFVDAPIWN